MFLKLPFAVSFSVLFITIQYTVFRKSFRTSYVSLYIYINSSYDDIIQRRKVLKIVNVELLQL